MSPSQSLLSSTVIIKLLCLFLFLSTSAELALGRQLTKNQVREKQREAAKRWSASNVFPAPRQAAENKVKNITFSNPRASGEPFVSIFNFPLPGIVLLFAVANSFLFVLFSWDVGDG